MHNAGAQPSLMFSDEEKQPRPGNPLDEATIRLCQELISPFQISTSPIVYAAVFFGSEQPHSTAEPRCGAADLHYESGLVQPCCD